MNHGYPACAALIALFLASCTRCPNGYKFRDGELGNACYQIASEVPAETADSAPIDTADDTDTQPSENPYGQDPDLDGDGYPRSTDCNETDPYVNPGAEDTPYDGLDQDCSGADLSDVDLDGYDAVAVSGTDCNDNDASVHPGATEVCGDETDQECSGDPDDGRLDEDGDGFIDYDCTGGDDCDDGDAAIHPGADETCEDTHDLDCDGTAGDRSASCCSLSCSCATVGLTCGTGSLNCSYGYDSYGRVTSVSCTYGGGESFYCSITYDGVGIGIYRCSTGEAAGDSCTFSC